MTDLLAQLPYEEPFRFIDEILSVDGESIQGSFRFREDLGFYRGHFRDFPITPGVILTETMAQIGLVAFGLYLMKTGEKDRVPRDKDLFPLLTSSQVEFYRKVLPGNRVIVKSRKIVFRHGRLKCAVLMEDEAGNRIAEGTLSGLLAKL